MSKGHMLQDPYLNQLRKERIPVSIFLVNGIKLQGQIESFDQFVVLLRNSVSGQWLWFEMGQAVEIAGLYDMVRGFDEIKLANVDRYRTELAAALDTYA